MEHAGVGQADRDLAFNRKSSGTPPKSASRRRSKKDEVDDDPSKRRCVSTACIACRYVEPIMSCEHWATVAACIDLGLAR